MSTARVDQAGQQARSRWRPEPASRPRWRGRAAPTSAASRSPTMRRKSTGQRFSVKTTAVPRLGGEDGEHAAGERQRGQRQARQRPQCRADAAIARTGRRDRRRRQRAATTANSGRVRPSDACSKASEQQPLAREGQQHQQHEEDAEGGGVGVRQDEVERRAGEADRRQQGRRQERGRDRQQLARERVEGAEDRRRLQEPEGERGGEAGAEDLEGARKRVEPGRAVEVADVLVGDRALGDQVGRGEVARRRRSTAPPSAARSAPSARRRAASGRRTRARRRWPAGRSAAAPRRRPARGGRADSAGHVEAGRTAPTSSAHLPGREP